MSTQPPFGWGTEAEDTHAMKGLSIGFLTKNALPHLSVSLLTLMALPDLLGLALEPPRPPSLSPAHVLAHLALTHGALKHACQSAPIAPFPGAMEGSWLGCQLFLSPRSSLSYKIEKTWKLKQEKQLAGQRAPGAAMERKPSQSDHIIHWFSWGDIYG